MCNYECQYDADYSCEYGYECEQDATSVAEDAYEIIDDNDYYIFFVDAEYGYVEDDWEDDYVPYDEGT